jgi:hypothetical protein
MIKLSAASVEFAGTSGRLVELIPPPVLLLLYCWYKTTCKPLGADRVDAEAWELVALLEAPPKAINTPVRQRTALSATRGWKKAEFESSFFFIVDKRSRISPNNAGT